jgi:[methyl-Co(III) methanol-specific corrinoid protein]:coenzyme M methyltransferase
VAAMTTVELQEATGCFMPEVHRMPDALARLCFANHDVLGFDAVCPLINYFSEPAALGCRLDWGAPDRLPVYRSHPWENLDDAVVPGDLLDRSPIRECLEALRIAVRDYGDKVAVLGKVMGPLSMVQVMHGLEATMLGLVEDPDRIRRFLEVALKILVQYANAQFDEGITAVTIGEGGAGAQMVSPATYQEFLAGTHRQLVERTAGPTILHMCGDVTPRLEMIADTGVTCFNFDWAIRPDVMKHAAHGRFSTMGNINTADLLNGPPEVIERQVLDNLEAGTDVISPGCALAPTCPNENLTAMTRAIRNRL